MLGHTLAFILSCFVFLAISRTLLAAWQWQRVRAAGRIWPVLLGGLRIDAIMVAMLAGLPLLFSFWFGSNSLAISITVIWLLFAWFLLVLLEVSTPQFIFEYDTRPNRLYVEYLKHPKEVFGMLWKGYRWLIFAALILIALLLLIGYQLFGQINFSMQLVWWQKIIATIIAAAIIFISIRGTFGHRPLNPSSVAYCGDGMLNTLPLNSLYSVIYAIYSMKNERSAADVYGKLPDEEVIAEVNLHAEIKPISTKIPSLHAQKPKQKKTKPLNLVIIVEESLGAQFSNSLGGKNLTPCLDELAKKAWYFTHAYATGTRSVRGLEAIVAGFPPTISDAALRLSGAQSNFYTLAQTLRLQGYRSRFIYGGEAHFDNMKGFFLGNGFDELHDLASFNNPAFVGTWGASDEDMFNKLDSLLSQDDQQASFTLAFSVSNHSPWEYPQGRVKTDGNPATVENTVRYADWSIGEFFKKASNSDYWDNTVFLVVADHDSRVFGANLIPVKHFHIPALILGADITARTDNRIISQIDLPTTLLSLLGIECEHPMIGRDLTTANCNRAMMQYGDNYGYLKENSLLVLEPHRKPTQYQYTAPDLYTPEPLDESLFKEALSHVLWPRLVYKGNFYTLPQLRAK